MFAPFTRDELELLERGDFRHYATAVDPGLAEMLPAATSTVRRSLTVNDLGDANHQLVEALERFVVAAPAGSERRTARALSLKLRAALEAAQRP